MCASGRKDIIVVVVLSRVWWRWIEEALLQFPYDSYIRTDASGPGAGGKTLVWWLDSCICLLGSPTIPVTCYVHGQGRMDDATMHTWEWEDARGEGEG